MEKFNLQVQAKRCHVAALPLLAKRLPFCGRSYSGFAAVAAAAERRLHGGCRADFGGNNAIKEGRA